MAIILRVVVLFDIAFAIVVMAAGRMKRITPFISAAQPRRVISTETSFVHVLWNVTSKKPMTIAMKPAMYVAKGLSAKSMYSFL